MSVSNSFGRVVHVNDKVEGAVYIGRANARKRLAASPLANPYTVKEFGRDDAISRFRHWLMLEVDWPNPVVIEALIACRDKPLACWCRHDGQAWSGDTRCHGDVILQFLQTYTDDQLRSKAD